MELNQLDSTTYKITPQEDPNNLLEVIIGDDKELNFKNQIKIQKWQNEANISIRLKSDETKFTLERIGDTIKMMVIRLNVIFMRKKMSKVIQNQWSLILF